MSANAGSVMTTPVIAVNENATLKEAIEVLAGHKFSGLPVIDNDNKIVGILSESDILNYSQKDNVIPLISVSGWISPHTEISDIATVRKGFELLAQTIVKKVMSRKIITTREDTPVIEIARLMNKKDINRIPVVDDSNRIIGIVSRADIIRSLVND